jgi:two-component system, LytTR family, sensor kinase
LIPAGILLTASLFIVSKGLRNYIAFGDSLMNARTGFILHFNNESVKLGLIASSAFYGMMGFILLLGIYDLAYHFAKLRHTEKERDRLGREKLQAELQQLKGIVNPHFLFNNLNSLSSLISENPSQAEEFLDELTRVFRYLLKNNELELTTIFQELTFINSYFHLLQTRYGKGIIMHINVSKDCESYLLPPLTLQLLVENAVKHNRIHKEEPLTIEIFSSDDNELVVRNNLMLREQRMESTGIGLKSINTRFKLLNHVPLTIKKENGYFDVIIPLMPSNPVTTILSKPRENSIAAQNIIE